MDIDKIIYLAIGLILLIPYCKLYWLFSTAAFQGTPRESNKAGAYSDTDHISRYSSDCPKCSECICRKCYTEDYEDKYTGDSLGD